MSALSSMRGLARVAALRIEGARRAVAAAEAEASRKAAAVTAAEDAVRRLAREAEERRAALRDGALGQAFSGRALADLLDRIGAEAGALDTARARVSEAEAARAEAVAALQEARAALLARRREGDRRERLLAPLVAEVRRAADLRDEAEVAETFSHRGRGPR